MHSDNFNLAIKSKDLLMDLCRQSGGDAESLTASIDKELRSNGRFRRDVALTLAEACVIDGGEEP